MRKTNINQVISYKDIKPGDKVSVTGILEVKDIRIASDSPRLGKSAIATVAAPIDSSYDTSWAILESDKVTLLERDVEIEIPANAAFVYWQDTDDEDYYARKLANGKWQDSEMDEHHSADILIEDILEGEYGEYKLGSFEVIKHDKPKYASGGLVSGAHFNPLHTLSPGVISTIQRQAAQRVTLPRF